MDRLGQLEGLVQYLEPPWLAAKVSAGAWTVTTVVTTTAQ